MPIKPALRYSFFVNRIRQDIYPSLPSATVACAKAGGNIERIYKCDEDGNPTDTHGQRIVDEDGPQFMVESTPKEEDPFFEAWTRARTALLTDTDTTEDTVTLTSTDACVQFYADEYGTEYPDMSITLTEDDAARLLDVDTRMEATEIVDLLDTYCEGYENYPGRDYIYAVYVWGETAQDWLSVYNASATDDTDTDSDTDTESEPVATVTEDIADAFGMTDMPNVTVKPAAGEVGSVTPGGTTRHTKAGEHSSIATERILDADKMLAKLGLVRPSSNFSTAPVVNGMNAPAYIPTKYTDKNGETHDLVKTDAGYDIGTAALDEAYDRLATSRRLWEERPLIEDALAEYKRAIQDEGRIDYDVDVSALRMTDDGVLTIPGQDGIRIEVGMLEQLLGKCQGDVLIGMGEGRRKNMGPLFPGAWEFLLTMEADERAWVMNNVFKRGRNALKIRTRLNRDGDRSGYAVVSPSYGVCDGDRIVDMLLPSIKGKGYRGEIAYEASSTNVKIDMSYHAPDNITDFAAGDAYQTGMRFRSNDTGAGRFGGSATADWNACLNFIILSHAESDFVAKVHKGSTDSVTGDIMKGMAAVMEVQEHFARSWGVIQDVGVYDVALWGQSFESVDEALRYGVEHKKIDMQMSKDIAVEMLLSAHERGNKGEALAAIVDAVTRAAHEAQYRKLIDDCARDAIERAAGALVPVMYGAAGYDN